MSQTIEATLWWHTAAIFFWVGLGVLAAIFLAASEVGKTSCGSSGGGGEASEAAKISRGGSGEAAGQGVQGGLDGAKNKARRARFRQLFRLVLPAHYASLAVVIFTGFVAWAFAHFTAVLAVWAMAVLSVLFIGASAVGYKRFKRGAGAVIWGVIAASEMAVAAVFWVILK